MKLSTTDLLLQAISCHKAGQLKEAEKLYRAILLAEPSNTDANHNLGIIMVQADQAAAGIQFLKLALETCPTHGQYWLSYIETLIKIELFTDAQQLLMKGKEQGLKGSAVDDLEKRLVEVYPQKTLSKMSKPKQKKSKQINKASQQAVLEQNKNFYTQEINKLIALFAENRYTEALPLAKSLTQKYPRQPFGWKALGAILKQQGQFEEALGALKKSIILLPDDQEAHYNFGNTLMNLGRLHEAEACYRNILHINPEFTEVHNNLGLILKSLGRIDEAESHYFKALQINPNFVQAHFNLAIIFYEMKKFAEAEASYQNLLRIKPNFTEAHNNLGLVLKDLGRFDEAKDSHYRALQIKPDYDQACFNLGVLFFEMKDWNKAEAAYRCALQINPNYFEAYNNIGVIYHNEGKYNEAIKNYNHSLAIRPDYLDALNNLGETYLAKTLFFEAEKYFRKVLSIDPMNKSAWANLLFGLNYQPDMSADEIYAIYEEYNQKLGVPLRELWQIHTNIRDKQKRLKVGYVSPDFKQHSVSTFLEPVFRNHNKSLVEIFVYAELKTEDQITKRYRDYADHWLNTMGMNDTSLAERIRKDQIDILVDLAGHTVGNRLGVFALKPSPVSISWLGFGYTTGLKAIDYYLGDKSTLPVGCDSFFSETPWRLDECGLVYQAKDEMGSVSSLPAIENGYVTFGSLSRSIRINHHCIRVWAKILRLMPTSRLILNSKDLGDTLMQETLHQKFSEHGIESERVLIGFKTPPWDILRSIDISLDCFPHNSGTTLIESLYMGVPYITLASRPSVGRIGSSPLVTIGYSEWIAENEDEYINKTVALASDLPKLVQVRSTLRKQIQKSALMDEVGFTLRLENAYRDMWKKWCEKYK